MLRLFESAVDVIVAARRRRLAEDPDQRAARHSHAVVADARSGNRRDVKRSRGAGEYPPFIAAGHETTANSITWTLYLLSQSSKWHNRVQAEADRAPGGDTEGLSERLVETRVSIEEANRLYPPIAAISRAARAADELAGVPIRTRHHGGHRPYALHRHRTL